MFITHHSGIAICRIGMMFSSNKNLCAALLMAVLPSVIYGEIIFFGQDPGPMAYIPTPIPFKCVKDCDNYNDGISYGIL